MHTHVYMSIFTTQVHIIIFTTHVHTNMFTSKAVEAEKGELILVFPSSEKFK